MNKINISKFNKKIELIWVLIEKRSCVTEKPFVVRSTQKRFFVIIRDSNKTLKGTPYALRFGHTEKPFVVRSTQKRFRVVIRDSKETLKGTPYALRFGQTG